MIIATHGICNKVFVIVCELILSAATEILAPRSTGWPPSTPMRGTDHELLAVLIKSRADGSPHTIRVYQRVGERFLNALVAAGSDLRRATVEGHTEVGPRRSSRSR